MADAVIADPNKIEIGDIISRTFAVIGANLPVFAILSVALIGVPSAIMQFLVGTPQNLTMTSFALAGVIGLVSVITNVLLQAAVVRASVVHFNGGKPQIGEILKSSLGLILPLIGLSILVTLGVLVGLVLLIVPGIILAIMWSVAVPARVVEKVSIIEAIKRSAALTKGSGWSIFLLTLVVLVLAMIAGGVLISLPMMLLGPTSPVVQYVLSPLTSAASSLLGAAGVAALYFELRTRKEGATPAALAAVFD